MAKRDKLRWEHALVVALAVLMLVLAGSCAREQPRATNTPQQTDTQQPEQNTNDNSIDKTHKELVVATVADYPPFEFEVDGELVGFDIELIEYLSKSADIRVDLQDMDFDSALRAVAEGRADMAVAAIQPTEERAKDMDFSKVYYVPGRQCVLVAKQNADIITSKQALDGAAVACANGDIAMALLTKDVPGAQLLRADDEQAAVEMLLAGEADAAAVSWIVGQTMCLQYEQLHMSDIDLGSVRVEGICVAVRKGDDALLETVNTAIDNAIRLKLPDRWMENAIKIMAESPVQY